MVGSKRKSLGPEPKNEISMGGPSLKGTFKGQASVTGRKGERGATSSMDKEGKLMFRKNTRCNLSRGVGVWFCFVTIGRVTGVGSIRNV